MAQSLNDSTTIDMGVLEADHLQQENEALHNGIKEMEQDIKGAKGSLFGENARL